MMSFRNFATNVICVLYLLLFSFVQSFNQRVETKILRFYHCHVVLIATSVGLIMSVNVLSGLVGN